MDWISKFIRVTWVWRSPRDHGGHFLDPWRATQNHSFEFCLSFSHAKSVCLGQNACVSLWEEFSLARRVYDANTPDTLWNVALLHQKLILFPFNWQFLKSQAYNPLSDWWKQLTRSACLNNNKTKTFQNIPQRNEYMQCLKELKLPTKFFKKTICKRRKFETWGVYVKLCAVTPLHIFNQTFWFHFYIIES